MIGRWIFYARILVTSAAVLSAALALWLATPAVACFLADGVPRIYGSLASWLTPLYLCIIINAIIIFIAATSRYQKTVVADGQLPPFSEQTDFRVADADLRMEVHNPRTGSYEIMSMPVKAEPEKVEFVISRSSRSPRRGENQDPPEKFNGNGLAVDKPLVSARLSRRRSIKASPEAKQALRVARPRKKETLESTWRTLTEGRAVPLARHLKKSDTWATHARATAGDPTTLPVIHDIQKLESLTARSSGASGSSPPSSVGLVAKLRRESSLGQDDLHRRVEAFIKKVNQEMRLQR